MRKLIRENHVEALRILLTSLNIKFTSHTLNKLKIHPYFPNPISLNHVLNELQIENVTLRASYEQMQHELPKPLLAHIHDNGGMYLVVAEVDEEKIYYVNEKGKLEAQAKNDFMKSWSGIAMLVDNEAKGTIEKDYIKHRTKDAINKVKHPFAFATLCFLMLYALSYVHVYTSVFTYLFLFTKAIGIGISIPLMIQLVDKNNSFVKKLCASNNPKTNCSSILDSPGAYFFGVFAWSEVGFVYFISLFFYLLFVPSVHAVMLVSGLAILAAPYTVYSIYYQWKVAKLRCRLCLLVQAVLVIELILAIIFLTAYMPYFTPVGLQTIAALVLIPAIIISLYSLIKPIVIDWKKYKTQVPSLNRIKLNAEVFHALLHKCEPIDTVGICPMQFGNPEGRHQLTIITNPTCKPCIGMHQKLHKILKNKDEVLLNEILLAKKEWAASREQDDAYQRANFMLKIYRSTDAITAKYALADYYDHYTDDFERWKGKHYRKEFDTLETKPTLEQHIQWCLDRKITSTPVIFYNGYKLPGDYTVADLDYLLD